MECHKGFVERWAVDLIPTTKAWFDRFRGHEISGVVFSPNLEFFGLVENNPDNKALTRKMYWPKTIANMFFLRRFFVFVATEKKFWGGGPTSRESGCIFGIHLGEFFCWETAKK